MTHDLGDLLDVLDLKAVAADRFVGRNAALDLPRVFGGQVAAQALVAAGRTVDSGRTPQSLHADFLRPGRPEVHTEFVVETVREGRSRSNRAVVALQDGKAILRMTAAFGVDADSTVTHQVPTPAAPAPMSVRTLAESVARYGGLDGLWTGFDAVEIRIDPRDVDGGSRDLVWMRAAGTLPDDPLVHAAVACYATDLTLLSAALVPHGLVIGRERDDRHAWDTVSLDHALWLHRIPRADDWMLFDQHSPVASWGRALSTARIFAPDGELVATVLQEGLLRASPI
ncbi:acyl-CoA thioesterase [Virgisporangium aurantiacum]|uniref:Acyl-CoA thioesterase II n=1 Tax=Virgisporangium aurantiacum TaxID=175570 RepID=A0A8J3Z5I3_9ACTN|nr:acyl-CoA thioesterase domain-containing protein [Virgisporangium aurantiacum]GIJ55680.1 acyl-CoA thioesterase II [Virgisporangium aurantiacum]